MKSFRERIRDTSRQAMGLVRQAFRAVLQGINAGAPVQLVQAEALKGEQLQAAELFQHFGFTSAPPTGTQLIVLPLGGQTAHSVIIATENGACRIAVRQGEVCVYNQWGAYIKLLKDRIIEMDCDQLKIRAKDNISLETRAYSVTAAGGVVYQTPAYNMGGVSGGAAQAEIEGALRVTDDITARNVSLIGHVHRDSGGSGNSGAPVN